MSAAIGEYGIASATLHAIKVTPTGTFALPQAGDINNDSQVDSHDSTCFIKAMTGPSYQQTTTCNPGDIDGDGDVDLGRLLPISDRVWQKIQVIRLTLTCTDVSFDKSNHK